MRHGRLVLLALLVLLAATGCGATATPQAATPGATIAAPWGAGDRAEYTIEAGGTAVGLLVFTTGPGSGGGYMLTTETTMGAVSDVSKVRVDDALKPLGATRQLMGAGKADFALMTVYDKGKLSIQAKTADGDKAATIDVPADAWDNDQLLMSIRALPLAEGFSYAATIVVGASASMVKAQLTVIGKESVTTPAGSFTAHKVELGFGPSKHTAWYDVAVPHHIVKYENPDAKQVIVLTKVGTP